MSILLTAIAFIVIFSILVLIHECGHFFVAKKAGIKVEEFGFGLPPRLWGVKKGETIYSINAIPFGGFVRLLGEDGTSAKVLKDKRSFAAKPIRLRLLVVVAGVVMNFLLAVFLLTIGFTFGMKPLILSGDDVLQSISSGNIATLPGVIVKSVDEGSAAERAGLLAGDRIMAVRGKGVTDADQLKYLLKNESAQPGNDDTQQTNKVSSVNTAVIDIVRNEQPRFLNFILNKDDTPGINLYEIVPLPRLAIKDLKPDSFSQKAGLRPGDVVLKINNHEIYFYDQYAKEIDSTGKLDYQVLRGPAIQSFTVESPVSERVIISNVYPESNAEAAGLRPEDVIVSIDGQKVDVPEDVVAITQKQPSKSIEYVLKRNGQEIQLPVKVSANGLIGVGLSVIASYESNDLSLYSLDQPTSVIRINDVSVPFYIAPFRALDESIRLGGLTIDMFLNVIKSLVTKFAVPEGVAGPVGIAQMTSVFVNEGIMSLMRFMALLSLSLAMINILPFPALDGGRLLFILIELVIGRKVNPRFEAIVHAVGFALLMLLIVAVTYSDILRLIFG